MGKRQENKAAKRNALLREALALFTGKGFDATSIEQIARAAGVARGTFYLYFPDREALLDALVDAWFSPLVALLDEEHARLAVATTRAESLAIYEDIGARVALLALEHRDAVLLAIQEVRSPGDGGRVVRGREAELALRIEVLTALAAERGLIDAPMPGVAARVVIGAIEQLFWTTLSGDDHDPLAVAAEAIRLLSRALGIEVARWGASSSSDGSELDDGTAPRVPDPT